MDPLSALTISCAVMQVISFSHEVFTVAKRIAEDGSPDANLADTATQLTGLSKNLQSHLATKQNTKPLNEAQQRLEKVAQKCLKTSKELTEELDKIEWKPGSGSAASKTKRSISSQTLTWWWRRSKIGRLQKEMREVEKTMQSSILEDLW
jgi:wobble nucleotide-excising tRNase